MSRAAFGWQQQRAHCAAKSLCAVATATFFAFGNRFSFFVVINPYCGIFLCMRMGKKCLFAGAAKFSGDETERAALVPGKIALGRAGNEARLQFTPPSKIIKRGAFHSAPLFAALFGKQEIYGSRREGISRERIYGTTDEKIEKENELARTKKKRRRIKMRTSRLRNTIHRRRARKNNNTNRSACLKAL